jgi:hypothetical protein
MEECVVAGFDSDEGQGFVVSFEEVVHGVDTGCFEAIVVVRFKLGCSLLNPL